MFACEQEGVTPDIMAIAKGLTGGYLPLAATFTTEKIYQNFKGNYASLKTFFHGHTYTGNPLACAAALGSLQVFAREKTLKKLQYKIKLLAELLEQFKNIPQVKSIRQCGFIAALELPDFKYEDKIGIRITQEARRRGLIIRPLGNNIVIMPPLSISNSELKKMMRIIYESIQTTI